MPLRGLGRRKVAELVPISVKSALKHIAMWHRRMPKLQGALFASSCADDAGALVGVAVAGWPCRSWMDQGKIVISRVATNGHENACSMLYGSLCRAAKALGWKEAWTYTHLDEPGTSLRAAGFMDMGLTDGGEWDRPSRKRQSAVDSQPKRRWLRILNGARAAATPNKEI